VEKASPSRMMIATSRRAIAVDGRFLTLDQREEVREQDGHAVFKVFTAAGAPARIRAFARSRADQAGPGLSGLRPDCR